MALQIEDARYFWIESTESTGCAAITRTSIFAQQSQKLGRLLGLVTRMGTTNGMHHGRQQDSGREAGHHSGRMKFIFGETPDQPAQ
jgi:hypothetical protein